MKSLLKFLLNIVEGIQETRAMKAELFVKNHFKGS
jgi:hypothetical protein